MSRHICTLLLTLIHGRSKENTQLGKDFLVFFLPKKALQSLPNWMYLQNQDMVWITQILIWLLFINPCIFSKRIIFIREGKFSFLLFILFASLLSKAVFAYSHSSSICLKLYFPFTTENSSPTVSTELPGWSEIDKNDIYWNWCTWNISYFPSRQSHLQLLQIPRAKFPHVLHLWLQPNNRVHCAQLS